jgi:DNA-binding response OmpR family regulator
MDSDEGAGTSGVIIKCSSCGKFYKVFLDRLPKGISSISCRKCGTPLPIPEVVSQEEGNESLPSDALTVLVSVNEEELAALVCRILNQHHYRAIVASSGQETLDMVSRESVHLLLINVFLPDMIVFEILDQIRKMKGGRGIPTILLSSVHHAARYKRAPTSLYGADEYIERHHLPDLLIPKIQRLLEKGEAEPPAIDPAEMPPLSDEQVRQRRELEQIETEPQKTTESIDAEVRRMCRVIVGDIALYNEDVISSTEPARLLEAIAEELREGEALLLRKFPDIGDEASSCLLEEIKLLLGSRGIQIP